MLLHTPAPELHLGFWEASSGAAKPCLCTSHLNLSSSIHFFANEFTQFCDGKFADGSAAEFYVDEYRSVVHVADIVDVISWFVHGGATRAPGVYNMGGPERVNRYEVRSRDRRDIAEISPSA